MTELPGQLADPGRYLRAQRELADVSRNTLARPARVSESYLAQVEKGPGAADP
jgi:predicted transcriptional regulator